MTLPKIQTIEMIKYPKGKYYVSANCGPEKDIELMELHEEYDEWVVVINGCAQIATTFDEKAAKELDRMLFHLSLRDLFEYKSFQFGGK